MKSRQKNDFSCGRLQLIPGIDTSPNPRFPRQSVSLQIIELEADGVRAGALEAIENERDFTIRNVAWGFNEHRLLKSKVPPPLLKHRDQFRSQRREIVNRTHVRQTIQLQGPIRLDSDNEREVAGFNLRIVMRLGRKFCQEPMWLQRRRNHEDDQQNEQNID